MKSAPTAHAARHFWRQVLLTWLWLCGGMVWAGGANAVGEYQVKAVFLFNFTRFVDWPVVADTSTNSPFVISIVGEDPFGSILDEAIRGESVRNRRIVIRRLHSNEPIAPCDCLFIARSEKDRLKEVLDQVKSRPTLTVADTAQAVEQGVMINLSLVQGSVKMEINPSTSDAAGLKISAKLLNLARIVNPAADRAPPQP
jgi:hypothetical protein